MIPKNITTNSNKQDHLVSNIKEVAKKHSNHASISIPIHQKLQLKLPTELIKKPIKEKEEPSKSARLSRVSSCRQLDQPQTKLIRQATEKNLLKNLQNSTQDNFTISYLLEQDGSRETINFQETSDPVFKDIEIEMKSSQQTLSRKPSKLDFLSTLHKKPIVQSTTQLNRNSIINTQPVKVIKKKVI